MLPGIHGRVWEDERGIRMEELKQTSFTEDILLRHTQKNSSANGIANGIRRPAMTIRSNQIIIGPMKEPDEIVLSLFRQPNRRINPHEYRVGNKTSSAQQRYNWRMSNMHIVNLILNNFLSSDYFITLTYAREPKTLEMAEKEFDRFLINLARFCRNRHIKCLYVGITERGEKGRYHHHFVLRREQGIDEQDIKDRWWKRGVGALGHVQIDTIQVNEVNKKNTENDIDAVYYIGKYITKNAISSTKKRFKHSEGLKEPLKLSSDDLFTREDYTRLCENPDSNESVLMLVRKLCPNNKYELVDRRVNVKYIEGAGYFHVSARLRKAKKDSYVDFSMPDVFSFNYKEKEFTNNSTENDMITYKVLDAWITQKQKKIPNLREIMDTQWREYTVKHIKKYIKANMTMDDAIKAIDTLLQDQNNKNKFARILLTYIGKKMQNKIIQQIELPKNKKTSKSNPTDYAAVI